MDDLITTSPCCPWATPPLRLRSGQTLRVGFARDEDVVPAHYAGAPPAHAHCPGFRYVYFASAMLRGQTIGASSASWFTLSYWMSATGASMNW